MGFLSVLSGGGQCKVTGSAALMAGRLWLVPSPQQTALSQPQVGVAVMSSLLPLDSARSVSVPNSTVFARQSRAHPLGEEFNKVLATMTFQPAFFIEAISKWLVRRA